MNKALSDGVIPTVAFFAHAADKLVISQYRLKVIAGILTAAIRMQDKPFSRITP